MKLLKICINLPNIDIEGFSKFNQGGFNHIIYFTIHYFTIMRGGGLAPP